MISLHATYHIMPEKIVLFFFIIKILKLFEGSGIKTKSKSYFTMVSFFSSVHSHRSFFGLPDFLLYIYSMLKHLYRFQQAQPVFLVSAKVYMSTPEVFSTSANYYMFHHQVLRLSNVVVELQIPLLNGNIL